MNAEPHVADDPTIGDSDRILRRVHRLQIVRDENRGRVRPSSGAFDDGHDGVSVFLSPIVTADLGLPEAAVVDDWPDFSLVGFPAALPRDEQVVGVSLGIVRDPDPLDATPHSCSSAHCLITGVLPGKPGKRQQRRIAEAETVGWVVLREAHTPPAK